MSSLKKLILSLLLLTTSLSANSIDKAFAFAIYDENGRSENIQNTKNTQHDYNEVCYTKIAVFGKVQHNTKVESKIGNSIGTFVSKEPILNFRKIVIGYEYTFKHLTVSSGLLQVVVNNRLFDSRVFVK